jgi:predicted transcriptional regulator
MSLIEAELKALKNRVEGLEETVSLILDRQLFRSIKRGLRDIDEGRIISLEDYERSKR